MDMTRAKQIVSSPAEIDVKYNGVSVWIENCNENADTVNISLIENREEIITVPVQELQEQ